MEANEVWAGACWVRGLRRCCISAARCGYYGMGAVCVRVRVGVQQGGGGKEESDNMEADGGLTGSSHGSGCVPAMLLWSPPPSRMVLPWRQAGSPEVASVVRCSQSNFQPLD